VEPGVAVRGTIDCIVAQTCIAASVELPGTDRDFAAPRPSSQDRVPSFCGVK
jgi:hypothetical protein